MTPKELAGRRILITRAADDADQWAARLAAAGAHPLTLPCLICESITDAETAARLRSAIADADWLMLTSARGAQAAALLLDATGGERGGSRVPRRVRVGAVGQATARAAIAHLSRVDLVAQEATAMGLAREIVSAVPAAMSGQVHVVIAGAAGGRADVEELLHDAGISVTQVAVYRTTPAPAAVTKRDLAVDRVEVVLLASPSAVTGLMHLATVPPSAQIITIGPTTSSAAAAAGLVVAAEAREPTFEGIMEAIV